MACLLIAGDLRAVRPWREAPAIPAASLRLAVSPNFARHLGEAVTARDRAVGNREGTEDEIALIFLRNIGQENTRPKRCKRNRTWSGVSCDLKAHQQV